MRPTLSAHRTPDRLFDYAERARERGLAAIIAGAGGAAHLPGMMAAKTTLPVLGVPVPSGRLNGLDSLLSIVQMPAGGSCGDFRHRPRRRGQCGAVRRRHRRGPRPGRGEGARRLACEADRLGGRTAGRRSAMTGAAPLAPGVAPLAPGAAIGVLGGGQLGRMLALAAARLGYRVHVFRPERDSPAAEVAAAATRAAWDDEPRRSTVSPTRWTSSRSNSRMSLLPPWSALPNGFPSAPARAPSPRRRTASPRRR